MINKKPKPETVKLMLSCNDTHCDEAQEIKILIDEKNSLFLRYFKMTHGMKHMLVALEG
jgi:hypothetical protein